MPIIFLLTAFLLAVAEPDEDPCAGYQDRVIEVMEDSDLSADRLQGFFQEALDCYGAPSEETARQVHNLFHEKVNYYYDSGQHAQAFRAIDTFFDVFADYEEPDLYFRMYQWEGFIHFKRADLDRAVRSYARSFAYTQDVAPSERAHVAEQVAILYQRLQDIASAQYFLGQAMEIMEEEGEHESERGLWIHVRVLNTKSHLLMHQATTGERINMRQVEHAAELAQEALALLEGMPPDAEHGSAHLRLAQHAQYAGDYAAATDHLQEAGRIAREVESAHLQTAVAHNTGTLYVAQEDWARAERAFQETFEIAVPSDFEARAEAKLSLGAIAELQDDWEEAEVRYRESIEQHAIRRSNFRTTEWAALDQRWKTSHRALIRSLLAQGRNVEAFQALDQASAHYLQDVRLQARVLGEASMETRTQYDNLTSELATIRHSLLSDTLDTSERAQLVNEEGRLLAKRGALLELEDVPDSPSLEELQGVLAEEEQVLLAYFIDEVDPTVPNTPRSHVFLVTQDTLVARPLATTRTDLRAKIGQVNPMLVGEEVSLIGKADFSLEALHTLYALLVEPVADRLPTGARLVVIPDEPLHSLPFSLLATEPASGYQYRSAPFMLRDHAIATELAPRLLLEGDTHGPAHELDVLAFGQATFSGREATLRGGDGEDWSDLPAVRTELSAIDRLFRRVETALDEEATEPALLEAIDRPAVLHLASHAVLDRTTPFRNAVILAADPSDTTGFYDGRLHLHKLQQAPLSAELVVLSGCDTAQGALLPSEGMASLQYGFRTLGVKSSLATLWLVEDVASADLMTAFYRNLRAGQPKDIALQQAQLAYLGRAEGMRASPFFWAAPVLYGTPRPVALEPRPFYRASWFPLSAALLVVVLLGSAAVLRSRRIARA